MESRVKWELSTPVYESDLVTPKLRFAYWEGHRDFAYDLIKFIKPERIVELGSQYGCSLFAFCQAAKDFSINSEINAVDFWKDDIGATETGEEVFLSVKKIKEEIFPTLNLNLYQASFDNVVNNFPPESIDILHIDGGHRYEDVDHDFNLWLPKLKQDGIILFHDIFSHIDRGSCEHWKYIKTKFNVHFEFEHSCGLGVLFPKGDFWYKRLLQAGFNENIKKIYMYRAKYNYTQNRFVELSELYETRLTAINQQSKMIEERDEVIEAQKQLIDERLETINQQSKMIEERDEVIEAQKRMIDERLETINQQSKMIEERDEVIEAQKQLIEERLDAINQQSKMIDERDQEIHDLKDIIRKK